jgi:hypothetical protein
MRVAGDNARHESPPAWKFLRHHLEAASACAEETADHHVRAIVDSAISRIDLRSRELPAANASSDPAARRR